jgi:type I restriction enzyme S subunit
MAEIAPLVRRPVKPAADKIYREIGIRSFGKGVFHKPPTTGIEIGNKRVFAIEPDDLLFNIVFAWEGAVAVAGEAEQGMIGSHRFLTCVVDKSRADPRFLSYWFRRGEGRDQLLRASPGGAGRNRTLGSEKLAAIEIPLPPLDEQRRIVARIEDLASKVEEARRLRNNACAELTRTRNAVTGRFFPVPQGKRVRDYARFQTGYAFKSEWFVQTGIRVARNTNVAHGQLDWSEIQYVPKAFQAKFSRFDLREGDVLVSLDRPLISTGVKVARVRKQDLPCLLLQRVARAVIVSDDLDAEYLFAWLRSPAFVNAIDPGRSNGVPHISHKDIEAIPFAVPTRKDQRRIVAELDALQSKIDAVKVLQAETSAELDAMLPAILDKAFKGEL